VYAVVGSPSAAIVLRLSIERNPMNLILPHNREAAFIAGGVFGPVWCAKVSRTRVGGRRKILGRAVRTGVGKRSMNCVRAAVPERVSRSEPARYKQCSSLHHRNRWGERRRAVPGRRGSAALSRGSAVADVGRRVQAVRVAAADAVLRGSSPVSLPMYFWQTVTLRSGSLTSVIPDSRAGVTGVRVDTDQAVAGVVAVTPVITVLRWSWVEGAEVADVEVPNGQRAGTVALEHFVGRVPRAAAVDQERERCGRAVEGWPRSSPTSSHHTLRSVHDPDARRSFC
jgi:hypothetical protein